MLRLANKAVRTLRISASTESRDKQKERERKKHSATCDVNVHGLLGRDFRAIDDGKFHRDVVFSTASNKGRLITADNIDGFGKTAV